jgi:hypothetical protein
MAFTLLMVFVICETLNANEVPRIGVEIELSRVSTNGNREFGELTDTDFTNKAKNLLLGIQKSFGGQLDLNQEIPYLMIQDENYWRVDKEWVNGGKLNGLELVTPPLLQEQTFHFSQIYSKLLNDNDLAPGLQTSIQFNLI